MQTPFGHQLGERMVWARQHAQTLMKNHGLKGWRFEFDDRKARLGACYYKERKITLSRYFMELVSKDEIHDTILHEIAHAIAGSSAGHGPAWKAVARQIGCNAQATYKKPLPLNPAAKWTGQCPQGHTFQAHRLHHNRKYNSRCVKCLDDPNTVSADVTWTLTAVFMAQQ